MGKGNIVKFVVLLVLSVVVNEVVAIIDAFKRESFLAGEAGLPFRFSSSSLFGGGSINYSMLFLDVIFWFVVLFVIWSVIRKVLFRS